MANSIGKMRYRVKVERATNTRDAGGGLAQSFGSVATIYANINPRTLTAPTDRVCCRKRLRMRSLYAT